MGQVATLRVSRDIISNNATSKTISLPVTYKFRSVSKWLFLVDRSYFTARTKRHRGNKESDMDAQLVSKEKKQINPFVDVFSLLNVVLNHLRFNLISLEPKYCGHREKWLKSHHAIPLFLFFCGMIWAPLLSWKMCRYTVWVILTHFPLSLVRPLEPSPMGLGNYISISA